jgi:hypothetical protein
LVIGDTVHAAGPLLGHISNLRIVKGTAVYTTAFTPPTSPLTAIANTQLLTLQYNQSVNNNVFLDQSSFNNIVTRNGNATQGTFSPYSVTGWSNYFDGTGDYLSLPSLISLTGNFTIECWFNMSVAQSNYRMICGEAVNNAGTYVTITSTGLELQFGSSSPSIVSVTTTFNIGSWYHFAVVRSGTTVYVFINGVSQSLTQGTQSATMFVQVLGAGYSSSHAFNGYISNLRIINGTALYISNFTPSTTPLTATTNTSVLTCQSNRLIDNSINNLTLTKNGDVSVQALDPFGSVPEAVPISYSVYFDGTGDYLDSATNSAFTYGTGDFTIEFWAYLTAIGGTPNLIDQRGGTHPSVRPTIYMNGDVLTYYTNGGQAISGSTLVANVWYHIALSRNSGITRLFVNGSQVGPSYSDGNNYTSTKVRVFSDDAGGSSSQAGYCSNLRILKGTGLYTSTFTPSTTPLTAIANTSLLTCQSTRMIDNSTNNFTLTATGNTVPRIFNPFGYTAQSATSYTPSLQGGSAYFNGVGNYLSTSANTALNLPGDFTIEFWAYPTASISATAIAGTTSSNLGFDNGGYFYLTNSVSQYLRANDASFLTLNTWTHVAITRSGSTLKFFRNGIDNGIGENGHRSLYLKLHSTNNTNNSDNKHKYIVEYEQRWYY